MAVTLTAPLWESDCIAHVVPVIQVQLQLSKEGEPTLTEEADIRILLDAETVTRFHSASSSDEESHAAFLNACAEAFAQAIVITTDGREITPRRRCTIAVRSGLDGKPDHLAVSLQKLPLPPEAGEVVVSLLADAPATVMLSIRDETGKQIGRVQVLFPGEKSRTCALVTPSLHEAVSEKNHSKEAKKASGDQLMRGFSAEPKIPGSRKTQTSRTTAPQPEENVSTLWDFLRLGFRHILPGGLDHILFITGLFLFSHHCRPLITQVTVFTVAHSITLGLSTLGIYGMSSHIAEPLIAASIVVVGAENCLRGGSRKHAGGLRLAVVFGFGLIHGLGIANMLDGYNLGETFLIPLVGFNLGVEVGQLAVVGLSFLVLGWWLRCDFYHRRIAVPLSLMIACVGAWWFVERCFFPS